jgi:hypothetical protein
LTGLFAGGILGRNIVQEHVQILLF